ncbi:MAG: hypothetical protein J6S54_06455 [Lentisphaeria bacterium]|nr:hypothetical protein [Lentisphaeria bacterium]
MAVFTSENILVVPDLDSYELKEGQINGGTVFDDSQINDAADAAQAAASKLIIAEGADATYTKNQWYFLNCDDKVVDTENGVDGVDKFSYDYLVDSSLTYDLEVNGTLKSYQVLLNNAETVVSESGKLFATSEVLRVMGGTFTVKGTKGAADPAASEVFTGTWGLGTQPGSATQIKGGYLQINQGAVANFNDTVVFINAGWFNVNDAEVAFDNTYIYLGSGGSYAPVAVQFQNGANVTLANNSSMVYDPEFTMNITVDATSTFALSDSKLSATSLTNDGKFTVAGESQVVFGSQTGTIDVLDGAVLADSKVGNVNVYGVNTWTGTNTIGSMSIGWYNSGADIVTNITGTATVANFMIGNSQGFTSTLNIGDANGERTVINGNQHNYTTNSVVNVNKADVTGNYASMTGLITITDSTYSKFGDFRVVSGGNHTITPGVTFVRSSIEGSYGYIGGWGASDSGYGVLSLQDNSEWKSNGGSLTTAKSVVTVDGSKFIVGGAFTHNGTLAVTGASSLQLKKVAGSGSIYMENAALSNSTVGGTVMAYGENSISGETAISSLRLGYKAAKADNATVNMTGAFNGSFIVGWEDGYADSSYTLNIGDAKGDRTTVGKESAGGSILNVHGVNGSANIVNTDFYLHQLRANGDVSFTDSNIYLMNVDQAIMATVTLDGSVWDASNNFNSSVAIGSDSYKGTAEYNAALVLTDSTVNAYKLGLNDAGSYTISLTAENSTIGVETEIYIGAGATLTMDAASLLQAETLTGTGTITIDAADFSGDIKTVIDLSGTASIEDRVGVINKAEGVSVIYGADGDVMLTKDALSTSLYFDWQLADSEYNVGDKVADGKYFGINTFASIDGLKDVVAGADTLTFAGGNETSYYTFKWDGDNNAGRFYLDHSATITTTGDDVALFGFDGQWGGAGMYIVGDDTKVVFDADSKIKSGDLVIGSGAELSIGGYLTMGVFNAENRSEMRKGVFNFSGKVTIEDGADFTLNGGMLNNGTLVLNENFTINQTQGAGSSSFGGKAESSTEINGVTFTYNGFNDDRAVDNRFFVGGRYDWLGGVQQDIDSSYASIVTLTAGADIVINNAQFIIGANGVVNLDSSCSITVDGAVTNNGVINFTFAEAPAANTLLIDANAASNYGTVTVTGAAGLEAVTVGEDLYLLDMSKIYVNSDYAGLATGAAIEGEGMTGVYFGINAFDSFDALNASAVSQGKRRVEYTYNGSDPAAKITAAKITVANDSGTLLSYTFDDKSYNFYSGSRTHEVTLTDGGTYTFDFSKGDFSFDMVPIVKNSETPADIGSLDTDEAGFPTDQVSVSDIAGNKEYTFTVAEGKIIDLSCAYDNVSGTGRIILYKDGDQLSTRLFSNDGTFVANGLEKGSYKVVFESYDDRTKASFGVTFDLEETVVKAINAISDGTSYDDVLINSGAVTKEYTFDVAADMVTDFTCAYSDVSGTGRLSFFKDDVQLSSRLFSSAGTFTAQDLTEGSYKVVFASYDDRTKVGFDVNFDLDSDIGSFQPDFISSADDLRNDRTIMNYDAVKVADIAAWGGLNDAAAGLDNWVGTKDKTDWFGVEGIAAGTHNFGVDVEGDAISVTLYSFASGKYTSLAVFTVTDKSDGAADYTRSVKIASDAELVVKVSGLKSDSDYSIAIA